MCSSDLWNSALDARRTDPRHSAPGDVLASLSGIGICAYFDTLHDGRKLIPSEGEVRWQALRLTAATPREFAPFVGYLATSESWRRGG